MDASSDSASAEPTEQHKGRSCVKSSGQLACSAGREEEQLQLGCAICLKSTQITAPVEDLICQRWAIGSRIVETGVLRCASCLQTWYLNAAHGWRDREKSLVSSFATKSFVTSRLCR